MGRRLRPSTVRSMRRNIATLALVQALLAYEWLDSSVTKLVHGDFVAGLAADLRDRAASAPGWYAGFLRDTVAPHASLFGWAIELGELSVGLLLLAGALLAVARRRRRAAVVTALGAAGGILLAVNFALSTNASFFPGVAPDSFGEGVSLDVLAVWLQVVLLGSSLLALHRRRRRPLASSSWTSTRPRRRSSATAR